MAHSTLHFALLTFSLLASVHSWRVFDVDKVRLVDSDGNVTVGRGEVQVLSQMGNLPVCDDMETVEDQTYCQFLRYLRSQVPEQWLPVCGADIGVTEARAICRMFGLQNEYISPIIHPFTHPGDYHGDHARITTECPGGENRIDTCEMTATISSSSCDNQQTRVVVCAMARFSEAQIAGRVTAIDVDEASGLAASRKHPNILYTMNDAGNTPVLFAIDGTNGDVRARFQISNTNNTDWEDLALGPCDSSGQGYCIYIGDVGRHNRPVPADRIMRIREPETIANGTLEIESTLEYFWDVDDCETVLVDPQGEVYLVSKIRGGKGYITHVPASGWGTGTRTTVTSLARILIPYTHRRQPVGGDISPNGQEILIRTRKHVYYWRLAAGESYITALSTRSPLEVPTGDEPQGESVCWSSDGSRYYTLSEEYDQPLYYFERQ